MTAQLPPLPEIERVSTSVVRVRCGNPGKFTLQGERPATLGALADCSFPGILLLDLRPGVRCLPFRNKLSWNIFFALEAAILLCHSS
jgi:hypothetical protein